tara:strand:- start:1016 stop:1210 length:195 start_codon:yes stop_codon:yes gene_type:complete
LGAVPPNELGGAVCLTPHLGQISAFKLITPQQSEQNFSSALFNVAASLINNSPLFINMLHSVVK